MNQKKLFSTRLKATWCLFTAMMTSILMIGTLATAESISLLPLPQSMKLAGLSRRIEPTLSVSADGETKAFAEAFARQIRQSTGWTVPVKESGDLRLALDPKQKAAYRLLVTPGGVEIVASNTQNLCYGFQSFLQLCPPEVYSQAPVAALAKGWPIACLEIEDAPRFGWRGILVDVSRAFQTKEEMLKLLDSMAMVKLNVLHWHLTDDQGWRPEIKAYPKLTPDPMKSYTQEELRTIVAYAETRGITIVPEFDMPGHSAAVARAYPELCVAREGGEGRYNVYDVSNPDLYVFLAAVMKEMVAIFPGAYIHIGADEVATGCWNKDAGCRAYMEKHGIKNIGTLQAHFVEKVTALIQGHGRQAMAWDEAFHKEGSTELSIMSWRGVQPGIAAARLGHKVVLTPVSALYYDRAQSRSRAEPEGYSRNTVVLSQSYFFEPAIPFLDATTKANILGAQGSVWAAKINGGDHVQRMVMPRGAALAESLWSPRQMLDWESFLARLEVHRARLNARGIPFWWEEASLPRKVGGWQVVPASGIGEIDLSGFIRQAGLHEFLFHYQQGAGSFNLLQAELLENGKVVAVDQHAYTGTIEGRRPNKFYLLQLPTYNQEAKYTLRYTIEAIHGGCSGVVMLVPPLAAGEYSEQRAPTTESNVSDQKQPDEM